MGKVRIDFFFRWSFGPESPQTDLCDLLAVDLLPLPFGGVHPAQIGAFDDNQSCLCKSGMELFLAPDLLSFLNFVAPLLGAQVVEDDDHSLPVLRGVGCLYVIAGLRKLIAVSVQHCFGREKSILALLEEPH